MKTRVKHLALFSPLLLVLAGGCVTKALWNNGRLEAWKEPADKLNLHLFEAKPETNLLVIYNEFSERSEAVHPRAYWLNENQALLNQGRPPHFIRASSTGNLTPVPVFYDPVPVGKILPADLCAVVATNKQSFTLYRASRAIASHDLPVYNDGKASVEKVALTPLAVTAGLTLVGGLLGYLYLLGNAQSPGPWY